MTQPRPLLVVLLLLASCGGSGSDPYQAAVDQANEKEAEARAAGVLSPCADVSQCGVLSFQNPSGGCLSLSYKPYSLVSPTAAAASAAASEQNALARQALALVPSSGISCPAVLPAPPVLTCAAGSCGP